MLAGLLVLVATSLAAQQLESRTYRVTFPSGATGTTIRDQVTGHELVNYRVALRAGQVLVVNLNSNTGSAYFNLFAPGRGPGDAVLANSGQTGRDVPAINRFQAVLAQNGDYMVSVHQERAAAMRGSTSAFSLQISATSGAVQLPGGPPVNNPSPQAQFLQVTGVAGADQLNVRAGPSTANPVEFTLRNGEVVRSLGCTGSLSDRWCQVHRVGRPTPVGWASGRYLVAARDPGNATNLPAPPPSTSTGTLSCTLVQVPLDCPYRVSRTGGGNAVLTITRPIGPLREITFAAGRPVSSNSSSGVFGEWSGSTVIVSVGSKEKYVVRNEILFGR